MKNLLWVNNHFAWPLVSVIVYISVMLLITDYLWRVINTPVETLLTFIVLGNVVIAVALVWFAVRFKKS